LAILQAATAHRDRLSARRANTRVKGGALASVSFKTKNSNIWSDFNHFGTAIGRAVIDKNNFVIQAGERGPQLRLQDRHVRFFVKNGNHDGDGWNRGSLVHNGKVR